jgi:hypothetical protein
MTLVTIWRRQVILAVCSLMMLTVAGQAPAAPASVAADLNTLSDEQLLARYVETGLAVSVNEGMPSDRTYAHMVGTWGLSDPVHQEIISRGPKIVPALMEFLKKEVPLRRPEVNGSSMRPEFTRDCINIIGEIGDPRPAPLLLEILDGYDGKATMAQREAANAGLETLTHTTFLTQAFNDANGRDMIPHTATIHVDLDGTDKHLPKMAAVWKEWLAGEGKDPKQWLPLACARARKMIESDDPSAIECAVRFLVRPSKDAEAGIPNRIRDDRPQATLDRMVEVMNASVETVNGYEWKGKHAVHPGTWVTLIGLYGPIARPYAKVILHYQDEVDHEEAKKLEIRATMGAIPPKDRAVGGLWYVPAFQALDHIGGKELMAYAVGRLPEMAKMPNEEVAGGQFQARLAITRWAGRTFATDEEIAKWWEANKDKTQEEWLREGFAVAAAQADGGSREAIQILYYILPDLPGEYFYPAKPTKRPSFAAWVKANEKSLVYDENLGGFRLKKS